MSLRSSVLATCGAVAAAAILGGLLLSAFTRPGRLPSLPRRLIFASTYIVFGVYLAVASA